MEALTLFGQRRVSLTSAATVHGSKRETSLGIILSPIPRFADSPFRPPYPPYPLKKDEKNYCQNLVDSLFIAGTHRLVPPVELFFTRQ